VNNLLTITNVALAISLITIIILMTRTKKYKAKSKAYRYIYWFFGALGFWIVCMILQSTLAGPLGIQPVYFEYVTGIGAAYTPVILFFMSLTYLDEDFNIKKYNFLYIISTLMLVALWTNDLHHLFYINYSTAFQNSENGIIFNINAIYCYMMYLIAAILLLRKSYMKSGFFSIQTILIVLGFSIPLCVNILGAFKILELSVYITPILFTATAVCFSLAIIKFKGLNIIPVAFKTIIDTMSDAFIVVSEDGTIADLNKTFINKFKSIKEFKDKDNLFEMLKDSEAIDINKIKADIQEAKNNNSTVTKEYHIQKGAFDKYFEIDFQPIKAKDGSEFVATLILLRDTTTAKRDMEIMMKNENLVILGELAGGVAHDINTPISAIKSGLLMIKDMVPTEDGKMLVSRMDSCADKIVTLTNSLRNQIRNIGSEEIIDINVANLINDVQVITHNELVSKNVKINIDKRKDVMLQGSPTKFSQVITNLIVNSIQAYGDKGGGMIDIVIDQEGDNAFISIEDWAGGISEEIRPYIFKNILTTKGVSGTGFGLYLAYSVIKGSFGGEITFETIENKGTRFEITVPLNREEKNKE